jgi:hypothetical protein
LVVTYQVNNLGPQQATGVVVSVQPPPPLVAFVSATPSQGTFSFSGGTWTIGNVPAGGLVTLAVQYQEQGAASGTSQLFGVSVTQDDQFDPSTLNNSSSASVTVM